MKCPWLGEVASAAMSQHFHRPSGNGADDLNFLSTFENVTSLQLASEWLQVITTFKGQCRTWNGKWGFGPRRCLQSWHTFVRVVHREKAFWWYVQRGFRPPQICYAALPEQVVDVVDPILLQEMKKIQRQEQTVATRFRGV